MQTYIKRLSDHSKTLFRDTDKLYALGDSGLLSLGRLGCGIAIARLGGTSVFAQYILLTTIQFAILSLVSTMIVSPMINLASKQNGQDGGSIINWSHKRLQSAFGAIIALSAAAAPIASRYSIDMAVYTGFVVANLAGLELHFQRAQLQIGFRTKQALLADTIGLSLIGLSIGLGSVLTSNPAIGFWWGSAISAVIGTLVMKRISANSTDNSNTVPSKPIQCEAKISGKTMLVGSLANSACSRLQPFILASIASSSAVAAYGFAWSIVGPLRMLSAALSSILRPRLALYRNNDRPREFRNTLGHSYWIICSIGLLCSIAAATAGPSIVSTIFATSIQLPGWLLGLAMAYASLDALTTVQMTALQTFGVGGAATASKLRILAAVASISLIFPACYWFGVGGAFGSLLLGELAYSCGATLAIFRHERSRGWIRPKKCDLDATRLSRI